MSDAADAACKIAQQNKCIPIHICIYKYVQKLFEYQHFNHHVNVIFIYFSFMFIWRELVVTRNILNTPLGIHNTKMYKMKQEKYNAACQSCLACYNKANSQIEATNWTQKLKSLSYNISWLLDSNFQFKANKNSASTFEHNIFFAIFIIFIFYVCPHKVYAIPTIPTI